MQIKLRQLEKISKLVKDNNNDVLKVCDILNLTDRETCFVLLICARDSFIDEDYDSVIKELTEVIIISQKDPNDPKENGEGNGEGN